MLNPKFLKNKAKKMKIFKVFNGPLGQALFSFAIFSLLFFTIYTLTFWGRIYPNIYIAGIKAGGKTPQEVVQMISNMVSPPETITLTSEDEKYEINLKELGFSYNLKTSSLAAYGITRTGNITFDTIKKIRLLFEKEAIGLRINLDENKLLESLSVIAGQAATESVAPSVTFEKGLVLVNPGKKGNKIDLRALRVEIGKALSLRETNPIIIKFTPDDPTLTENEADRFGKRAESLVGKKLILEFEFSTFNFKENELFPLLDPKDEYKEDEIEKLIDEIASQVERDPQNPIFAIENGKVKDFLPAKEGISVKKDLLKKTIIGNLRTLETKEETLALIDIPVEKAPSDTKTEEVNDFGIRELVGRGTSRFVGSISSRIHNIGVASSRFDGVLIPPNTVFSFNDVLGDVSTYTGYKQAYIIQDGKTVLGDGGGVCQVSTTFFRAMLDAGLPIVERRAHSYRVGYYEQDSSVGFDATVYSPTTDLKAKNDTPGYLLIQTYFDPKTARLTFEIYGTDDGRVSSTTKAVITSTTPPPEDLYTDDPALPAGVIKQVDYKSWGAKSFFKYSVVRDGETLINKTFYSNYQAWQAKFLRGTGPQI